MSKYFLKRLMLAILSLILIIVLVYFLLGLSGRDPLSEYKIGKDEETVNAIIRTYGLDKPLITRFGIYISNIITGKGFGEIYGSWGASYKSIPDMFFKPLKYTLWITLPSFFLSILLGVTLGFIAGYKRGTWVDSLINIIVIFFVGVPAFVLSAFAISFASKIGLPAYFIKDGTFGEMLKSLILPISVMTLTSMATFTYYTRNELVTVLMSHQVNIARTKGLSEFEVFRKHVVRNSSIPLVSIIVPYYTILLAGSLIIETFFAIPGTSSIITNAVKNGEFNVVMFNTIFFVTLGLINSIIVDVLYVLLDPRIKYSSASEFKIFKKFKNAQARKETAESEISMSNINGGKNE